MLAYMQGGASQPSGSQATVQSSSKTGLVDKALQAYTGISAAQTAKQGVNQQADMNDSSIKLNAANAAKSLQEAEKIKINNTKEKKYLPAHKAVGDLSRMAEKTVKEFFTNSAKKTNKMQVSPIYKNNPEYQKLLKKSLPKAGLK
ncbi:MAG: hypothetical protein KU29_13665 [Sulfurovum sp. FS06-10]|nr:MAG: hypothetical protein KU29_13665 [Sulfurovum sp. FS06-10]